jgi:hypothetical protein
VELVDLDKMPAVLVFFLELVMVVVVVVLVVLASDC